MIDFAETKLTGFNDKSNIIFEKECNQGRVTGPELGTGYRSQKQILGQMILGSFVTSDSPDTMFFVVCFKE